MTLTGLTSRRWWKTPGGQCGRSVAGVGVQARMGKLTFGRFDAREPLGRKMWTYGHPVVRRRRCVQCRQFDPVSGPFSMNNERSECIFTPPPFAFSFSLALCLSFCFSLYLYLSIYFYLSLSLLFFRFATQRALRTQSRNRLSRDIFTIEVAKSAKVSGSFREFLPAGVALTTLPPSTVRRTCRWPYFDGAITKPGCADKIEGCVNECGTLDSFRWKIATLVWEKNVRRDNLISAVIYYIFFTFFLPDSERQTVILRVSRFASRNRNIHVWYFSRK